MFQGAKIQLLDLPGIIEGAKDGKGRGKQVIAVARTCHLIFICLDVLKPLGHKKLSNTNLKVSESDSTKNRQIFFSSRKKKEDLILTVKSNNLS